MPDSLITIGLNDKRVAPWMSAKFAARAQARFGEKRKVWLRAESDGGHGFGTAEEAVAAEFADIFAFAWDRARGRLPWRIGPAGSVDALRDPRDRTQVRPGGGAGTDFRLLRCEGAAASDGAMEPLVRIPDLGAAAERMRTTTALYAPRSDR